MNKVNQTVWLIPVCCVCRLVRDDQQTRDGHSDSVREQWMSLRSFLRLHPSARQGHQLTHTYCRGCLDAFMEQLALDRRKREFGSALSAEAWSMKANTTLTNHN